MKGSPNYWRPLLLVVGLGVCLYAIWRIQLPEPEMSKLSSLVIILITGVYAIFTFEILLANRAMAETSNRSARIMEQSLQFSLAPNLVFFTTVTKDPSLTSIPKCRVLDNDDHRRALRELATGSGQMEFVYGVVRNIGRGSATKLAFAANYKIKDTANPNATYSVERRGNVQSLDPESAVAFCIYIAKVPTPDDHVEFIRAEFSTSDSYRDASSEPKVTRVFKPEDNEVMKDEECLLRVT